jgi:hypothetical protein
MALTEKQLGQLRPANTTAASLYSPGISIVTTIIKSLFIVNSTTTIALARIFVDNDGTTYDETTTIGWDIPIKPGKPVVLGDFMAMNDSTGNIAVRTDTASALTFTLFGAETTL